MKLYYSEAAYNPGWGDQSDEYIVAAKSKEKAKEIIEDHILNYSGGNITPIIYDIDPDCISDPVVEGIILTTLK